MEQVLLRPRLEVADILRAHGETYQARHPLSAQQRAVLRRLTACRTAALGGHVDACAGCGFRRISYNSCRDRHCPKCQALKRAQWLETRLQRLLPVPHFHVVFTLPEALKPLMLRNQRILYELLFRTCAQALLQLGADPKRLGIGGWSNGGFMTEYAITHTTRFKAAVAQAGHSDFFSLYGTSDLRAGLRVFTPDSPYYNRKPYDDFSPITSIRNCRTPTLLIHGINDGGVPSARLMNSILL